jgi:glycolate oxidase iron-sulfur subunit
MPGAEAMAEHNRKVFRRLEVDRVVANSAGCGLTLGRTLAGQPRVQDVLQFLGEIGPQPRPPRAGSNKVFVDLPCHLIYGQKVEGIPPAVLDATGYPWELAPCARDCCASGGVYNIQKPDNAREILRTKSAFLDQVPAGITPILATSNHVCMMQWNTAHALVKRPFLVRHVIQLLDPAA